MIKYFYSVEFSYLVEEDCKEGFDLGVFSTRKKAEEKIKMSVDLPGFNEYGIENFTIIKFGVHFDTVPKNKSNVTLYWVYHEYEQGKYEYYTNFGYFSTQEKAEAKVQYLRKHSRVGKKYPDNFDIVDVKVDNYLSWSGGFDKLPLE